MSRILGIDYGTKRIGLALSDELGIIAMPLSTVEAGKVERAMEEIKAVCVDKQVSKIVLGFPLNMDGSTGFAANGVTDFADKLRSITGIPVETWDERLTTTIVERMLVQADTRRDKRKLVRDQLAAQVILQSYLDKMNISDSPHGYDPSSGQTED